MHDLYSVHVYKPVCNVMYEPLSFCACVCVCVCVVCMCTSVCMHVSECVRVYLFVCVHVCMHASMIQVSNSVALS